MERTVPLGRCCIGAFDFALGGELLLAMMASQEINVYDLHSPQVAANHSPQPITTNHVQSEKTFIHHMLAMYGLGESGPVPCILFLPILESEMSFMFHFFMAQVDQCSLLG